MTRDEVCAMFAEQMRKSDQLSAQWDAIKAIPDNAQFIEAAERIKAEAWEHSFFDYQDEVNKRLLLAVSEMLKTRKL